MVKLTTAVLELLGLLLVACGAGAVVWHYVGLSFGAIVAGALLLGASFIIARRGEGT